MIMNKTEKKKSELLDAHKIEEETLESVSGGVDFEKYKDKHIRENEKEEFGVSDAKKTKGPRILG
jgi:hypothetical protein